MESSNIAATATAIATICGHAGILCNTILFQALSIHRVLVSLRFEIVAIQVQLQLIEELLVENVKLAESVKKIEIWNKSFDTVLEACGLTLSFVTGMLQEAFDGSDDLSECLLDADSTADWVAELQGQRGALRILVDTLRSKFDVDVEQVLDKEQNVFASIDVKARKHSEEARPWVDQLKVIDEMLRLRPKEPSFTADEVFVPNQYQTARERERVMEATLECPDNDNTRASDAENDVDDDANVHVENKAKSDHILVVSQRLSNDAGALRELDRNTHYGGEFQQGARSPVPTQLTRTQESPANSAISINPSTDDNDSLSQIPDYTARAAVYGEASPSISKLSKIGGDHRYQNMNCHEDTFVSPQPELPQSATDPWVHYSPDIPLERLEAIERYAPLHFAAFTGKIESMRELLYGPYKQRVGCNTRFEEETPIIYATRAGQTAAVEVLLAAGADPSSRGTGGMSSHHWAVICSHENIYRLLEQHSLPDYSVTLHGEIDHQIYKFNGWGLISLAAYFCNAAVFQGLYSRWLSNSMPYLNARWKVFMPTVSSLPYLFLTSVASNPSAYESWCKMRYDPFWLCNSSLASNLPRRLWYENEIELCKTETLSDRLTIIASVLTKVSDIEKKDSFGYTPLQAACCGTSTDIVEQLLRHGASPRWEYSKPGPILKPKPKKSGLRLFRDSTPSPTSIPVTLSNYALDISPLHLAAFWGRHKIIAILIQEGADPNSVAYGRTRPLHFAAAMGNTKAIQTLLLLKADVDAGSCTGNLCKYNRCEEVKHTPLSLALEGNHLEAMAALIKGGARLRKQIYDADTVVSLNRELKEDILSRAIRTNSSIEAIEMLLNNGADVNSFADNLDSPLNLAIKSHCGLQTIELLLSYVSNPNWLDSKGQPALHIAIEEGSTNICAMVRALLDAGADPHLSNPHLSYASGHTAIERCTRMISAIQMNSRSMIDAEWSLRHPLKDYIAVAQMLYDH